MEIQPMTWNFEPRFLSLWSADEIFTKRAEASQGTQRPVVKFRGEIPFFYMQMSTEPGYLLCIGDEIGIIRPDSARIPSCSNQYSQRGFWRLLQMGSVSKMCWARAIFYLMNFFLWNPGIFEVILLLILMTLMGKMTSWQIAIGPK